MDLEAERARIIDADGPWTAHNIHLGSGVYTRDPRVGQGAHLRARSLVQNISDLADRPIEQLRVADLGCLEGLFAVELAARGAEVVAIDVREAHLTKATFAKDALRLDRLQLILDDVRNFSLGKYGRFDVVLVFGILYHLDLDDVFALLVNLSAMTNIAILDTQVAVGPETPGEHLLPPDSPALSEFVTIRRDGRDYTGRRFTEHPQTATRDEQKANLWSSMGNVASFWLTPASLVNALTDSGFTTVCEAVAPVNPHQTADRRIYIAKRGAPVDDVKVAPVLANDERPRARETVITGTDETRLADQLSVEAQVKACVDRETELGNQLGQARSALEQRDASLQAIYQTRSWRAVTRWWKLKQRLARHR
jgi:SAM-dependent methyltransferase